MSSFVLLVSIQTKPGSADTMLRILQAIHAATLTNEPDTYKYYIAQSQEDENTIHVWEEVRTSGFERMLICRSMPAKKPSTFINKATHVTFTLTNEIRSSPNPTEYRLTVAGSKQ